MRRWGTGFAAVVLFGLGAAFAPPGAGAAVGQVGEPTIVVEQAQPLLAAYDYTVRVVGADGAPISGAAVTGTPVNVDGIVGRITTLDPLDQDGRYRGTVEMPAPGTWTVRFAVADPVANLEHVQEMTVPGAAAPAETPVTEAPVAEEVPPADEGAQPGQPDATEQPAGDAPSAAPSAPPAEDDDSSNAVPTLLAVAAAVLILAFGTAVVVTRRRREVTEALDAVQKEDPLHALEDDTDDDSTIVVEDTDDVDTDDVNVNDSVDNDDSDDTEVAVEDDSATTRS